MKDDKEEVKVDADHNRKDVVNAESGQRKLRKFAVEKLNKRENRVNSDGRKVSQPENVEFCSQKNQEKIFSYPETVVGNSSCNPVPSNGMGYVDTKEVRKICCKEECTRLDQTAEFEKVSVVRSLCMRDLYGGGKRKKAQSDSDYDPNIPSKDRKKQLKRSRSKIRKGANRNQKDKAIKAEGNKRSNRKKNRGEKRTDREIAVQVENNKRKNRDRPRGEKNRQGDSSPS